MITPSPNFSTSDCNIFFLLQAVQIVMMTSRNWNLIHDKVDMTIY